MRASERTVWTIETAAHAGARQLDRVADEPRLEAQVLLADSLGVPRTWLPAHPEAELGESICNDFFGRLARREAGVPLPHILGWWEFHGRRFRVTPDVLIPRPETEILVECGLSWLQRHAATGRVLDVGTGSGCIAVSLAASVHACRVIATDLSLAALHVARQNCVQHHVERRVALAQADLAFGMCGRFDLVCANLPYIPNAELHQWEVSRWEPRLALDGGMHGTEAIRRLLPSLVDLLSAEGIALLEIGAGQAAEVFEIIESALPGWRAVMIPDLAGIPRVIELSRITA
jgi:release factor glutamine methyltransferase